MAKILVVDDNRLIRMLLARALTDGGHVVYEAEDGGRAMMEVVDRRPDLVVTDFYMPGIDGAGLVRFIRELPDVRLRNIPIIGLAGTADSERRLMEAGTNKYLAKPFREKQLLEEVALALRSTVLEG
jgi:CheY-like chemotaxis protein